MPLPPTQILSPAFFDEGHRVAVLTVLDEIEQAGFHLNEHTVGEIRTKVRRKFRTLRRFHGFDDSPITRQMIDSIIVERQQAA